LDPFINNRPVTTYYENFYVWKCLEKAIQAEQIGNVIFKNIMTADNAIGGIDIQETSDSTLGGIDGAVVIGRSYGNPGNYSMYFESKGIMTSKTDRFYVRNVSFFNFGN